MQFLRRLVGIGIRSRSAQSTPTPHVSPPLAAPAPERSKFQVGWASHVGKVRSHNEDAALVITAAYEGDDPRPPFGLFILADGMGGHRGGEVASSLAARIVAHHIVRQFYLPALISHECDTRQPALQEVLVEAVQIANNTVSNQVAGGGTTLTYAVMLGPQAYIAHVGDSRAYVVTKDGLDQITHDHSLADRLVKLGQLTADEAAEHPQKNVLYRAVGQSSALEVDTYLRGISGEGRLLLCSDGLWSVVSEAEISDIITNASSLQAACEDLITAANRAGGPDNITAILLEPPLG